MRQKYGDSWKLWRFQNGVGEKLLDHHVIHRWSIRECSLITGWGGRQFFGSTPSKIFDPPSPGAKKFPTPLSRGQKIYDPLSIHVYVLYMSLTILIHVYVYKDISFWKMTIPLINLGKILVWKNDNSIDQPRFNIQGRVGARRLVGANLWLARSAKNNLIDGLFSFSQLQNCANTFSSISIFNVIHLHTELHTINTMYVEPILGRLTYWKMWQCRCEIVG